MKKVSIVVPIYNLEDKLEKCLESIRSQLYTDLEVLLVDDGSIDQSYNICKKFVEKDSRFHLFHHMNKGVSFTRNVGIKNATGSYLMFVDGDDYLGKNWVSDYVNAINYYNADVIIGGLTRIMEGQVTHITPPSVGEANNLWNEICVDACGVLGFATNKIYKRCLIKDNSILYDEELSVQEDWEFAFSVYCCTERIAYISSTEYYYEFVPNKRKNNLLDIISNQVKLLNVIRLKKVDKQKIIGVEKSIISLMYSFLYHSIPDKSFIDMCKRIYYVYSVLDYSDLGFRLNLLSPNDFVLFLHYHKYFRIIKHYYCIHHCLKRITERRYNKNES